MLTNFVCIEEFILWLKTSNYTAYLRNIVFREILKKGCREQYCHYVGLCTFRPGGLLMSTISQLPVDELWQTLCVLKSYSMTKNICLNSIFEKHRFQWDFWPNVVHSTIFIGLNCAFLDPAFYWHRQFLGLLWTDFDKLCVFWRVHSMTRISILKA